MISRPRIYKMTNMKIQLEVFADDGSLFERVETNSFEIAEEKFYRMMRHYESRPTEQEVDEMHEEWQGSFGVGEAHRLATS